jgi:hypothetical protein
MTGLPAFGSLYMTGPITRTVTDTIYAPDGSTPTGKLVVSNPVTFTSPDDFVIMQGSSLFVDVVDGVFSVNLVPYSNYQVRVQTTDQYSSQTWNVPTGSGDLTLADVLVS